MDPGINRLRAFTGLGALLCILFVAFTYINPAGQSGILSRFGNPVRVIENPGLHFKLPWPVDLVTQIDVRRRSFSTSHTEMLTRDKKNIILLSFVVWQVDSPLRFHQSVGSISAAEEKLDGLITNAKIGVLGKYNLSALTSTNPEELQVEAIEAELLQLTKSIADKKYGIHIQSVGFNRLSLPKANVSAVFKQMRSERKKDAAKFEAEGEKEASRIRSETDLDVARINAEALEKSALIRGQAEAEAAKRHGEAHSKDPELYRVVRSLETMDGVLGARSTVIIRTDSEPFKLLNESK